MHLYIVCYVIVCAVCNFLDSFHFCKDMESRGFILSPWFWFLITDDWMTQTSRYRADARVSKNPGKSSGWTLSFTHLSTWLSCLHFVRSNAGFPVWRSRARMTKPLGTVSKSPATTSSSPTTARTHAANSNVSGKVTYFLSINRWFANHVIYEGDGTDSQSHWIAFAIPRNMFLGKSIAWCILLCKDNNICRRQGRSRSWAATVRNKDVSHMKYALLQS